MLSSKKAPAPEIVSRVTDIAWSAMALKNKSAAIVLNFGNIYNDIDVLK
jgi:hypothetical protein